MIGKTISHSRILERLVGGGEVGPEWNPNKLFLISAF